MPGDVSSCLPAMLALVRLPPQHRRHRSLPRAANGIRFRRVRSWVTSVISTTVPPIAGAISPRPMASPIRPRCGPTKIIILLPGTAVQLAPRPPPAGPGSPGHGSSDPGWSYRSRRHPYGRQGRDLPGHQPDISEPPPGGPVVKANPVSTRTTWPSVPSSRCRIACWWAAPATRNTTTTTRPALDEFPSDIGDRTGGGRHGSTRSGTSGGRPGDIFGGRP